MPLTAQQLFQPAPSGVLYDTANGAVIGVVPQVPGTGSWLATMLQTAATVGLPTTSWQSGDPERTILATEAVCFSLSDACISQMAQGGFLLPAATGSVTYTNPQGITVITPVTPDPSNAAVNPTGAPGYLDLLANNVYDVTRLQATYVTGPLAIAKTTAGTVTYAVGAYHVGSLTGQTYHNTVALSIPSSVITGGGGTITAVGTGIASTIITTQAPHGLTQQQIVYILIPTSSGVSNLAGVFGQISATTATTFTIGVGSSGTYTGTSGQVFLCTVATMVADVIGIGSNAAPNTVTTPITQNAGVFVGNVSGWSGSNWETNTALANRCLLSLAAKSPNGPSQAYQYFAETAYQILSNETPSVTLTNGPVQALVYSTPTTGIVTTVVASSSPASSALNAAVTPGVSKLGVSNVTNASPAVIDCVGATGLSSGGTFVVTVSGVLGPDVNGTWTGTYVSSTSFSIPYNSTSDLAYEGGGSCEGGDLGQIDEVIQENCVPDNTTALTVSALALPIQVTATVAVPKAYVTAYALAAQTQLQAQIASYAIGGNAPDFEVAYDDITGALSDAGVLVVGQASIVRQIVSCSINGLGTGVGVPFPSNVYVALLVDPLISVLGV